jgi:hypothetical protein
MLQQIIIYIILAAAAAYVVYRIYSSVRKKECDKCALKEAVSKKVS